LGVYEEEASGKTYIPEAVILSEKWRLLSLSYAEKLVENMPNYYNLFAIKLFKTLLPSSKINAKFNATLECYLIFVLLYVTKVAFVYIIFLNGTPL